MAKIILEPGESFEHSHTENSITVLIEGRAKYTDKSISKELDLSEILITPPNISHLLENIGDVECVLKCSHGSPPDGSK